MTKSTLRRLTLAALSFTPLVLASPLEAQASGGGMTIRAVPARRDTVLQREVAQTEAERARLVARIEKLARSLDDADLAATDRRRLEAEIETHVRALSALHTRTAFEITTRIAPTVRSGEVRRLMSDAQRKLHSVTNVGYIGVLLSATPNQLRVDSTGLFVRYFGHPAIMSVEPNSPAARAGLMRGDTLLAYDGLDIRRELPMHQLLKPGRKLSAKVRRDGEDREFTLVVAQPTRLVVERRADFMMPVQVEGVMAGPQGARVAMGGARAPSLPARMPDGATFYRFEMAAGVAGAEMKPVTEGLGAALGVKKGVLVIGVAPRSPAALAGLVDGDVIVKADGRAVEDIPTLSRIMRESDEVRAVLLELVRNRKTHKVKLSW